jgi:flavin-binding protein dodecin
MAVVKVIELLSESDVSWEDAAKIAVKEAAKTVHNIQSVYIEHMQGIVNGNEIVKYRVNVKISFIVE